MSKGKGSAETRRRISEIALPVSGVLLTSLLRQSISLLSAARWKPDKNIVAVFIPLNPASQTALFGKTKKKENETKKKKKRKIKTVHIVL